MKKHILLIPIAAMLLTSCGDFLDEESQSEVIPKSASDYSELLIGSAYPDNYAPDFSWVEFLDDDCEAYLDLVGYDENWNPIEGFPGATQSVTPLPYYSWQPYMMDHDGFGTKINTDATATTYAQFYRKIMGCNAVLDNIDEAVGASSTRDRVKAEALAIRAMLYFQLVNIYGEPYNYNKEALGVPLKLSCELSTEGVARNTVAEAYEKVIVPDLKKAAELMDPLEIVYKNYRVNQPAIHILLSRVYLFMDKYQEAIDEANKALGCGITLMNLAKEFENVYGYYDIPLTYDNPEVLWLFGTGTRVGNANYISGRATDFVKIWDQVNDKRWIYYGLGNATYGSVIRKPYGSSTLSQNIRTAEAYLNKAEAEALLGKTAEANKDLATLRKSRIAYYEHTELSGNELLDEIRTERRREFCFEGFRWFDLRRYGMPEIKHVYRAEKGGPLLVYILKEKDPMYTIPLPRSLFEKNPLLIQNDSYNSPERTAVNAE